MKRPLRTLFFGTILFAASVASGLDGGGCNAKPEWSMTLEREKDAATVVTLSGARQTCIVDESTSVRGPISGNSLRLYRTIKMCRMKNLDGCN